MSKQVPIVKYLVLGAEPHLVANECSTCSARYFDDREACAMCFGTEFASMPVSPSGVLRTFTIVSFSGPGVPVPFVAGVVDCDGTSVKANIINVESTPEHVAVGMVVRLTTYSLGADDNGDEAIGFGFEPVPSERGAA